MNLFSPYDSNAKDLPNSGKTPHLNFAGSSIDAL